MNKRYPLVSVIMSVYEESDDWLNESVNSVLNQSFKDFEFIIINDNPSNELLSDLLENYKQIDSRIKIIRNTTNIGLTKSLNKAISIANGKYIARMDADDYSFPSRFQKQVDFLEKNIDYVLCGTQIIKKNNKREWKFSFPIHDEEIKNSLFYSSPFSHPSVMIRKSVLDMMSIKYDECFRYSQDYDLWCRLSFHGKMKNLNEYLLSYRISDSQISTKKVKEQSAIANRIFFQHLNKFLDYNNLKIPVVTTSAIKRTYLSPRVKASIITGLYLNENNPLNILFPIINFDALLMGKLYLLVFKKYLLNIIK